MLSIIVNLCPFLPSLPSLHTTITAPNNIPTNHTRRETTPCQASEKYRRPDGRCNNLRNPEWGSTNIPLTRVLPNAYKDNTRLPRVKGVGGAILPGPRTVSVNCHGPSDDRADVTLMVMQWGQFLDHDVALTPHPSRVEQQINTITAFVDGSNVYGSSAEEITNLRGPTGRLRRSDVAEQFDFLPAGEDDACRNETGEFCFLAGDERVNEQPGLAAMHTLFMREHNRIADELRRRFGWSSDTVFEEARKIVGAEIQHITYSEFLPIVLGPDVMRANGLEVSQPFNYNEELDPSISNEFATAAFRFGHSLIPEEILVNNEVLQFRNLFFKPAPVLNTMSELSDSLGKTRAMAMDRQFSLSITRHLFEEEERSGSDLVARNIQRGRDHGLRPYKDYRDMCSNSQSTSLDLYDLFGNDSLALSTYTHVDDVDLFTGGVAEDPVEGGLVGPTFACLMASQFKSLRDGDRFFYLNENGPQNLTRAQRNEIQKVRLSNIVCDNSENDEIQENVFKPEGPGNPIKPCTALPRIDLSKWDNSVVSATQEKKEKKKKILKKKLLL
ncbi:eosinophil peroxidase [Plakobranchus ocellatus]|uniref:Eosinophil peroxidase n=1 Tax=Plakobranchus ocellatus TaxID=259542 RepID=A0AAV4A731_9GAST|nr:eosinophil peroxidase [Plakobranchus ocellatus]